jgi:hypothetical protein
MASASAAQAPKHLFEHLGMELEKCSGADAGQDQQFGQSGKFFGQIAGPHNDIGAQKIPIMLDQLGRQIQRR